MLDSLTVFAREDDTRVLELLNSDRSFWATTNQNGASCGFVSRLHAQHRWRTRTMFYLKATFKAFLDRLTFGSWRRWSWWVRNKGKLHLHSTYDFWRETHLKEGNGLLNVSNLVFCFEVQHTANKQLVVALSYHSIQHFGHGQAPYNFNHVFLESTSGSINIFITFLRRLSLGLRSWSSGRLRLLSS